MASVAATEAAAAARGLPVKDRVGSKVPAHRKVLPPRLQAMLRLHRRGLRRAVVPSRQRLVAAGIARPLAASARPAHRTAKVAAVVDLAAAAAGSTRT